MTLVRRLGANEGSVRQTLALLVEEGWVERDGHYGHPLRPEYRLSRAGQVVGEACLMLEDVLLGADLANFAASKWALTVVLASGRQEQRFSDYRTAIPGATDRALSQALAGLSKADLLQRRVDSDARPPTPWYSLTKRAIPLLEPLRHLNEAVASCVPGSKGT